MLFSLPTDLAVAVLRDFLATHEDLSKLDMACAPSVRTDFLAILSSSSFILTVPRPRVLDDNLHWLASRRIKAQHVRFNYRSQAALLLEMDLTRLEILDTDIICVKKSMAHLILDRCPVLRSVVCREAGFLGHLPQHPTLPLREIACFSSGRTSSHVLHKLIAAFPNVEVLSLPEYLLKSADVPVMASGWTHLKFITFQQGHATPEEVATFLASFPLLETVDVTVCRGDLEEGEVEEDDGEADEDDEGEGDEDGEEDEDEGEDEQDDDDEDDADPGDDQEDAAAEGVGDAGLIDFAQLSRKELQALAKEHGIKANGSNAAMISALQESRGERAGNEEEDEDSDGEGDWDGDQEEGVEEAEVQSEGEIDLADLSRKNLQALAKKNGIKANGSNMVIVSALRALNAGSDGDDMDDNGHEEQDEDMEEDGGEDDEDGEDDESDGEDDDNEEDDDGDVSTIQHWTDKDTANLVARIPQIKSIMISPVDPPRYEIAPSLLTYHSFVHILKNCPQVTCVKLPFILYHKNQQQSTCSITFPNYESEELLLPLPLPVDLITTCLLACQVPISEVNCKANIDAATLNAIGECAGTSLTSLLIRKFCLKQDSPVSSVVSDDDDGEEDSFDYFKKFLSCCPNIHTLVVEGENGRAFMNTLCADLAVHGHAIRKISFLKEFFLSKGLKELLKVRGSQLTHFSIAGNIGRGSESWEKVVNACINLEELRLLAVTEHRRSSSITHTKILNKIICPNLLKHLRKFVVKDGTHEGLMAAFKKEEVDPRWKRILRPQVIMTKGRLKNMMYGGGRMKWRQMQNRLR